MLDHFQQLCAPPRAWVLHALIQQPLRILHKWVFEQPSTIRSLLHIPLETEIQKFPTLRRDVIRVGWRAGFARYFGQ